MEGTASLSHHLQTLPYFILSIILWSCQRKKLRSKAINDLFKVTVFHFYSFILHWSKLPVYLTRHREYNCEQKPIPYSMLFQSKEESGKETYDYHTGLVSLNGWPCMLIISLFPRCPALFLHVPILAHWSHLILFYVCEWEKWLYMWTHI